MGAGAGCDGIEFRDTDDKVHIPKICINENGSLKVVLQNHWSDGRGSGGCYNLLHCAKKLEIKNNPQVLHDLLIHAEEI